MNHTRAIVRVGEVMKTQVDLVERSMTVADALRPVSYTHLSTGV